MPSFHDWALVGLADFEEIKFEGKRYPACIKAAIVTFEQRQGIPLLSEWAELTTDPLREAVRDLDLMPEHQQAVFSFLSLVYAHCCLLALTRAMVSISMMPSFFASWVRPVEWAALSGLYLCSLPLVSLANL